VDEAELEDELEQMQQEQLDEQMLKGGTVPVADTVAKMPAAANGESKSKLVHTEDSNMANTRVVKGKQQAVEEDDEEEELRKLQREMAM
jgi:charged multivesicular body protein 4A/B